MVAVGESMDVDPDVSAATPNVSAAAPNVSAAAPNVPAAAPNVPAAAPEIGRGRRWRWVGGRCAQRRTRNGR